MNEDMIIFTRSYDLLVWLLPKGPTFPKKYRATLTQRLMDAGLDFQEHLFDAQANQAEQRIVYLQQADAALNKLRLYLRMVHQWGWISNGQYHHVSRMVAEIGRLLGGWQRTERGNTR